MTDSDKRLGEPVRIDVLASQLFNQLKQARQQNEQTTDKRTTVSSAA